MPLLPTIHIASKRRKDFTMITKHLATTMSLHEFAHHCAGLTIEKISIHSDNRRNKAYFEPLHIELRFSAIVCSCILPGLQQLTLKSDTGIVTFPGVECVIIEDMGYYEIATVCCRANDVIREYTLLIDYARQK